MVIQFERKQFAFARFDFEITQKGQKIGAITLGRSTAGLVDATGSFPSGNFHLTTDRIFGSPQWEGKINRRKAGQFQIDGQGGIIYDCGEKGSNFFNGIYFWEFCTQDRTYRAYEVGFGQKGVYYCIYENNQLMAIISKVTHTKHFESYYTIYAENIPIEWLALLNFYWDMTRYYPTQSSEEWHTLNTWQKELKNKFDPTFIPKIIAREGCQLIRCKSCGCEIPSEVAFCPHCGTHSVEPAQIQAAVPKISATATASMILGILSIGLSWCAIPGYLSAVIALILQVVGRKRNQGSHRAYRFLTIGRICALIGLVLTTFWLSFNLFSET